MDERLEEIIREVVDERRAHIADLSIGPDRVELIVEVDPQYGIHRLVSQMKARSSGILRREFSSVYGNPGTP